MGRRWVSALLMASWLGLCASTEAQPLPFHGPGNGPRGPGPAILAPPGDAPCPAPCEAPCPELCPPPDGPVDRMPHFQVGAEYLLWFTRKASLPPLVTRGNFVDPIPGALGQPGTRLQLSGGDLDDNRHHGLRVTLGVGLGPTNTWMVVASGLALWQNSSTRTFSGGGQLGSDVLARPFFDIANNVENADPVAIPAIASGTLTVSQKRRLYAGDVDLRCEYLRGESSTLHFLIGAKFLRLEESVGFRMVSQDLPGLGIPGNNYFLAEDIGVDSTFVGGQVGAAYEFHVGPVFLGLQGKVALGTVSVDPNLRAFARIVEPNGSVTTAVDRALYVSPNNPTRRSSNRFAACPEGQLKVGIDFNEYVRLSVGYTYLYITDVGRVGDVLNRNVNIQPIGTPRPFQPVATQPSAADSAGSFWAHGLDVGLRFSF